MKKLLFPAILLALALVFPIPATAGVDVGVNISLPPLIVFSAPPAMVVIPETYVYVVPDVNVDIFYYDGWWWRPWEGRWYRSRHYDSGWAYYRRVPSFHRRVPSGWRNDYREHRWGGRPWNYQPIPHHQVERNWSTWKKSNHWEKQQTWGVQGLKPRTQSRPPATSVQERSRQKPQSREAEPQKTRSPSQTVKPQHRATVTPQQSRPQTGEVQSQRAKPKKREAPQQSNPRQGKPEKGGEERQDRNQDQKR